MMSLALRHFYCPHTRGAALYSYTRPKLPRLQPNYKPIERELKKTGICMAELTQEAPFAIAIGACMLNSLLFPDKGGPPEDSDDDEVEGGVIGASDLRFTVMIIISFIPYFNWLSWVFAWLDTGKRRYALYAIVYLAPYIRSNLSLSPEESWLPIASIILGVIHVQLEASIRSGDIEGFQFFNDVLYSITGKTGGRSRGNGRMHEEDRTEDHMKLPSQEHLRDEIRRWGVPKRPSKHLDDANEDGNEDEKEKDLW